MSSTSKTFDTNIASSNGDLLEVFNDSFTIAVDSLSTGGSPNPFEIHFEFNSGFVYNGGNLVVDMTMDYAKGAKIFTDSQFNSSSIRSVFDLSPLGNSISTIGAVTRFEASTIPEPSALMMALLSVVPLLRRKRK